VRWRSHDNAVAAQDFGHIEVGTSSRGDPALLGGEPLGARCERLAEIA
jgi:hypothetical protein